MTFRITWPKLIGLAIGAMGLCLMAFKVATWVQYGSLRVTTLFDLIASVGSIVFLTLSYPLYRSQQWALCALVGFALFVGVGSVVLAGLILTPGEQFADGGPPEQLRRYIYIGHVKDAAGTLCLATAAMFFVFILRHEDVVAAFRQPESDATRTI